MVRTTSASAGRHGRGRGLGARLFKSRGIGVVFIADGEEGQGIESTEDNEENDLSRAVERLELCCTPPPITVYVRLLRSCHRSNSLRCVKRIQAQLAHHGCNNNGILGENLVLTLVKCGDVDAALDAFYELPHRTTFSWTAIISGLVEKGRSYDALTMYLYMQEEGIEPDHYTFVSLLKACGNISDLVEGYRIHNEIQKGRLTSDAYIGTTLIRMYGKCGALLEAENVWLELPTRNTVTWNSMLSAYVEQYQGVKALCLYRQMLEEGVPLDCQTLLIGLQACSALAENEETDSNNKNKEVALEIGRSLHSNATRRGYVKDAYIGNLMVSLYGKCNSMAEAENIFAGFLQFDVVTWTTHISMYVELNQGGKALQSYSRMQSENVSPNQQTLVSTLRACYILAENEVMASGRLMCLKIARALHIDAQKMFGGLDAYVGTTLMGVYAKCGAMVEAEEVFFSVTCHTIVQWNGMLSAYIDQHQGRKALRGYRQLQAEGLCPDHGTFVVALQACNILSDETEKSYLLEEHYPRTAHEIGQGLHADARKAGFALDVVVGTSLIAMYGKCGTVVEAETVFCGLPQQNLVACNAMLSAYIDLGHGEKALHLYSILLSQLIAPNRVTLLCVLQACSDSGWLEICHQMHFISVAAGHDRQEYLANTLIHTYGNSASVEDAQAVLSTLFIPLIASWNACLAGHAVAGNESRSWHTFEELHLASFEPTAATFTSLLSACSHSGSLDKGVLTLESMGGDFGLTAHSKQYVSLLDLLGRTGNLRWAEQIVDNIPAQCDLSLWLCLLSACLAQSNTSLAKVAFERAVRLQPMGATPFVLMANVYGYMEMSVCMTRE